ncbi:MAG: hypothetical protein EBV59_11785 [Synechococcaceae bacterium WB7_1C_051]|nr:hypothetical protein [Synechococcaceae bacterium WB7_1C_051]
MEMDNIPCMPTEIVTAKTMVQAIRILPQTQPPQVSIIGEIYILLAQQGIIGMTTRAAEAPLEPIGQELIGDR